MDLYTMYGAYLILNLVISIYSTVRIYSRASQNVVPGSLMSDKPRGGVSTCSFPDSNPNLPDSALLIKCSLKFKNQRFTI